MPGWNRGEVVIFLFRVKYLTVGSKFHKKFRMELFLPSFPFKMDKLISYSMTYRIPRLHGLHHSTALLGRVPGMICDHSQEAKHPQKIHRITKNKTKVPTVDAKNSIKPPGIKRKKNS